MFCIYYVRGKKKRKDVLRVTPSIGRPAETLTSLPSAADGIANCHHPFSLKSKGLTPRIKAMKLLGPWFLSPPHWNPPPGKGLKGANPHSC